jgi:hypothetical protein
MSLPGSDDGQGLGSYNPGLSAFERTLFDAPTLNTSFAKKPARVSLPGDEDDDEVECVNPTPKKKTKKQQKADNMANKTAAQRKAVTAAVGSNAIIKPTSHIDHHYVLDTMMTQIVKTNKGLDSTLKHLVTSPKVATAAPVAAPAVASPNSKILKIIEKLTELKQHPCNADLKAFESDVI